MERMVSKSKFKAQALRYFRDIEQGGGSLIITDRGRPVLKIVPFEADPAEMLRGLRGSVKKFEDPTEPVGAADWEVLG